MRRTNWKTVSTLVTMALVAGCAESVVSPKATPAAAPASVTFAPEGRPSLTLSGLASANTESDFTVSQNGGVFFVGNQAVVFPASSICDPTTSTYGIGSWNDGCTPLNRSITIHAVTRVSNGYSQVDFTPSLRFVPSDNPARWVWLFMYTPSAIGATDLSQFKIYYTPTLDGPLVDEASSDASLRTYVDTRSGISLRRVTHFSGYTSWGFACEAGSPGCTP